MFSPPPGFCFDSLCKDVIMDDSNLEDYNFAKKVCISTGSQPYLINSLIKIAEFVNYTRLQAESYATSNLIMTMGKSAEKV